MILQKKHNEKGICVHLSANMSKQFQMETDPRYFSIPETCTTEYYWILNVYNVMGNKLINLLKTVTTESSRKTTVSKVQTPQFLRLCYSLINIV